MAEIYVGLASNTRRWAALRYAVDELRRRFGALRLSGVYESPDIEGRGSAYLNAAARFESDLAPEDIRAELHAIEARAGRERGPAPVCVLDLDLLLCGGRLGPGAAPPPHPQLLARDHHLAPLAELAPDLHDPASGQRLAEQWARRAPAAEARGLHRLAGPEALQPQGLTTPCCAPRPPR